MIAKLAKCAALLLTVVTAKDSLVALEEPEVQSAPQVKASDLDWFLFSLGILLGSSVEFGTNFGA